LKNKLKISIITPSYNQGLYIEDAIISVLNQKYDNFEHIIIDGGSSDHTLEILRKYPHVKWISESDRGQSHALNKGFKIATGDVIGWLNADDLYLNKTFEVVSNKISENSIHAIYSNYKFIDKNGNVTKELITQKSKKWMSLFYCFIPSTTFFFNRVIIDEGILIDEDFHISMDKEFFANIYHQGYIIEKVDNYFAHFRWHDQNKSIDTKEVQNIRLNEGLKLFNRYSKYKFPENIFGKFLYKLGMAYCGFIRRISQILGRGIY